MSDQSPESKSSFFSRLPSFAWLFIFIFGIIALIGGVIALFYGLSNIEGFASIMMLIIAWGVLRAGTPIPATVKNQGDNIVTAMGVTFFALMGMAIDQPGNYLYNRPLEWFFCPNGTQLIRRIDVTHSRPGSTEISQDFNCVHAQERNVVKQIGALELIAVRFVEYILIAYGLIWLNKLYSRLRLKPLPENSGN